MSRKIIAAAAIIAASMAIVLLLLVVFIQFLQDVSPLLVLVLGVAGLICVLYFAGKGILLLAKKFDAWYDAARKERLKDDRKRSADSN